MVVHERALVVTVCVPMRNCHQVPIRETTNIEFARVGRLRVLLVLRDAPFIYTVGFPLRLFTGSYVTVPIHVTAFAAAPSVPLFAQLVIVHPVVVQFVPAFHLSQRVLPVIHPGAAALAPPTTALMANAVLLVILESHGFEIATSNLTLVPLAASVGVTGILTVSVPSDGAMTVVFVQVTPVPTCAPHDHPLSENDEAGPVIFAGTVRTMVWTPLDARFPAFVTVIGSCERR